MTRAVYLRTEELNLLYLAKTSNIFGKSLIICNCGPGISIMVINARYSMACLCIEKLKSEMTFEMREQAIE